jgi:hypothetical protein
MLFDDSVRTSDRTLLCVKVTSPLAVFREINTMYSVHQTKHINALVEKNAEFLNFIPNATIVANDGLLMVNSNIKPKMDRIHTHTHTHTQRICKATLLESLKC